MKETVKTIARGMPGCSGEPVVTTSCAFYFLHARLRVHRAPGIPCALCLGPNESCTTRAHSRRENAVVWLVGCERALRHRPRRRTIQYSRESDDGIEKPRRT